MDTLSNLEKEIEKNCFYLKDTETDLNDGSFQVLKKSAEISLMNKKILNI